MTSSGGRITLPSGLGLNMCAVLYVRLYVRFEESPGIKTNLHCIFQPARTPRSSCPYIVAVILLCIGFISSEEGIYLASH